MFDTKIIIYIGTNENRYLDNRFIFWTQERDEILSIAQYFKWINKIHDWETSQGTSILDLCVKKMDHV